METNDNNIAFMSSRFLTFVSAALVCLLQSAHSQETPTPKRGVSGVRLAIALTNIVLIPGSNTLLKCWITNDLAGGLVLERGVGEPDYPEKYYLEIWLRAEGGKEYVLVRGPSAARVSRMAEGFRPGEVHSYRLPLPIAADIPPGRYQLRAKRELHGPGTEVLSNILEVQVK